MPTNAQTKAVDALQQRLTDYACSLAYSELPEEVRSSAKARVIDNLGTLIGGFFGEPCAIARNAAASMPMSGGATVIGTHMKTTPDMAAFVNATTARYVDMIDTYHWPGSYQGHPADMVTPIIAMAEHAHASGRDVITAMVLAYEIFCRFCDEFKHEDFDNTNFACIGSAMAGAKLFGLNREALAHAISMAAVPNNILRQARLGKISMWKAVTSGQAGRSGVYAALLARAGMEGPHLPFEGKAGWCDHIARRRFTFDTLGGNGTPFKIMDTRIKNRAANGNIIASILAAEKVAPLNAHDVKQVVAEVYKHAKVGVGTGAHLWSPDSRETANHSLPYNVAATLIDGTITLRSFNEAHVSNPDLRALLQKIEVVENEEFSNAYERVPVEHRARVTVTMNNGERRMGESGGDADDLSAPKSDAQIEAKFLGLTEECLGTARARAILDRLWRLDTMADAAEIPPLFTLD